VHQAVPIASVHSQATLLVGIVNHQVPVPGDAEEVRVRETGGRRRDIVQELAKSGVDQRAASCKREGGRGRISFNLS
jgi:hypothetical protein